MKKVALLILLVSCSAMLTACSLTLPKSTYSKKEAKQYRANAFKDAKTNCALFSVDDLANQHGGNPSKPRTVARAYASGSPRIIYKAVARGCYKGLTG